MPATDLPLLIEAARAAGKVALGYVGTTARRWDKPGGAGPVTEADIAVNDLLVLHSTTREDDVSKFDQVGGIDSVMATRAVSP